MKLNWLRFLAILSRSSEPKVKPRPSGWELVEMLRNETKKLLGELYNECMLDRECFNEIVRMEIEIPLRNYHYQP